MNDPRYRRCWRRCGKNIISDKQSGKDFNRPGYRKPLRRLKAGDTLVVQSLDRLGRDYGEILGQWRHINRERGVSIVVLDMPLLCTKENQELIQQFVTDIVLQMLSFVAQTEREKIRDRQRQGIEAAKARGVRFGRPRLELPETFCEVFERWNRGEFSGRAAARMLGMSRSTFLRRARELCSAAAEMAAKATETSTHEKETTGEAAEKETAAEAVQTTAKPEAEGADAGAVTDVQKLHHRGREWQQAGTEVQVTATTPSDAAAPPEAEAEGVNTGADIPYPLRI